MTQGVMGVVRDLVAVFGRYSASPARGTGNGVWGTRKRDDHRGPDQSPVSPSGRRYTGPTIVQR
jgi:hypothetical protein